MTKDLRRQKTRGRRRGTPNRVTADVRQAIAAFAQNNVHRLQEWLDRIAEDDLAKAADIYLRLLEYHVPKLERVEIAVPLHPPPPFEKLSFAEYEALQKMSVEELEA